MWQALVFNFLNFLLQILVSEDESSFDSDSSDQTYIGLYIVH